MFEYFYHLDNQKKHSTHTKDKPSTSMIITKNLLSFIYTNKTSIPWQLIIELKILFEQIHLASTHVSDQLEKKNPRESVH